MRISLKLFVLSALSWTLAFAPSHAAPYFTPDTIPPVLIAPPPAVGSDQWNRDIEDIILLQQQPDPKEVEKAKNERNMSPEMVVLAVEPTLARQGFPMLYHLLDRVSDTSHYVSNEAKLYWKTRRPYLMDNRVQALIEPHDNHAYPSGHTTGSYTWAHVMGLLVPAKREAFLARAEEIAQHRVLVGMHYSHDLDGGRALSLLIVGGLLQNQEFRQDFLMAQQEMGAAGFNFSAGAASAAPVSPPAPAE